MSIPFVSLNVWLSLERFALNSSESLKGAGSLLLIAPQQWNSPITNTSGFVGRMRYFIKHEVALMWWFQSLPATACDRSPRAWHFCAVWIPQNLKLDLTCKRAPGSAFGWFLTPGASEFKSEQADADLCIWVIIVVISCFSYESCFWKLGVEGGALF